MNEPAAIDSRPTSASDGAILLVDDNADLRHAASELLRGAGYRVVEAASAEDAWRAWQANDDVSVLISDVRMPAESGIVLADRLRVVRPDLPVLLVSSHLDAGVSARIDRGDVAFRRKPFSLDGLRTGMAEARATARRGSTIGPAAGRFGLWSALAAALVAVAIGLGVLLGGSPPPPLPDVEPGGARRSFRVEPLAPRGPQATQPVALEWREVEGTGRYRVVVERPDGETVWQTETPRARVMLPIAVTSALVPSVRYRWRIEALDGRGARVAWSEAASFWIEAPASAHEGPQPEEGR